MHSEILGDLLTDSGYNCPVSVYSIHILGEYYPKECLPLRQIGDPT